MMTQCVYVFFFKQKTAYELRISDWSSDVCSSDLIGVSKRANLRHAELLSLGADSALTIVKARDIEDGARNYRYQQTYRGIPVYGEQIVVSENANGQVRAMFGRQVQGLAAEGSEERRVGKEWGGPCRCRGAPVN